MIPVRYFKKTTQGNEFHRVNSLENELNNRVGCVFGKGGE